MLALILAAILGTTTVYFSMQNQTPVSVQLGNYFWANVPLYFVSLVSLLVGISIAWLISTVGEIGSILTLWGKESEVNALKNYVKQLQVKLRDYSIENAIQYLSNLSKPGKAEAKKYISKSPDFIRTPLRDQINTGINLFE